MSHEIALLIAFLFVLLVIASYLKWLKQLQGQKPTLSSITRTLVKITVLSISILFIVMLPVLDQPRSNSEFFRPIGIVLMVIGIAFNIFAAKELKRIKFKMVGLGVPDRLITSGIFGLVRHPSSLGLLCLITGWCLFWRAIYCIFFLVPIMIIGIVIENKLEEKNLQRLFGDEFKRYKQKVGMYFPSRRREI